MHISGLTVSKFLMWSENWLLCGLSQPSIAEHVVNMIKCSAVETNKCTHYHKFGRQHQSAVFRYVLSSSAYSSLESGIRSRFQGGSSDVFLSVAFFMSISELHSHCFHVQMFGFGS